MYTLTAEQAEHFEEAGAYRFSRHCDTRGMNERSRLHTSRLGDQPQRRLDRGRIERAQLRARCVECDEMLTHSAQMLVDGFRVVLDRVSKKEASLRGEISETFDARLQQLEHGKEPRVTISKVRLIPESGGLKPRLHSPRELVGRQPHHVLLVEPVELVRIEDGVAAADTLE